MSPPNEPVDYYMPQPEDPRQRKRRQMEIQLGAGRWWIGFAAYAIFFIAVAALFVAMFVQFTGSMKLAVGLVVFLIGYMVLMGWWASRNIEKRDQDQ